MKKTPQENPVLLILIPSLPSASLLPNPPFSQSLWEGWAKTPGECGLARKHLPFIVNGDVPREGGEMALGWGRRDIFPRFFYEN